MAYQRRTKTMCVDCGGRPAKTRNLCLTCYVRHRRRGDISNFAKLGPDDVFEERIKKTAACWLWVGTKINGYGVILLPGERTIGAHRYAYTKWRGPIPEGFQVMHKCDVRGCVNPAHLEAVPQAVNIAGAVTKRRHAFGSRNGQARLSKAQVAAIRRDPRPGAVIGAEYGVTQSHVSRIKSKVRRSLG